ncbi:MAG: hypothetical protein K2N69_06585, partial [Helicobacter sp.]|nr:hypothetical protein [Helicobacter sp.]
YASLRALFIGDCLRFCWGFLENLAIVIASECNERGNQQARNPRIMKDSMPFDCFGYRLAMTQEHVIAANNMRAWQPKSWDNQKAPCKRRGARCETRSTR